MNRLTEKVGRRIMAVILSLAMILPNMTVYASEVSGDPIPAEEIVVNEDMETVNEDAEVVENVNDNTQDAEDVDELAYTEDESAEALYSVGDAEISANEEGGDIETYAGTTNGDGSVTYSFANSVAPSEYSDVFAYSDFSSAGSFEGIYTTAVGATITLTLTKLSDVTVIGSFGNYGGTTVNMTAASSTGSELTVVKDYVGLRGAAFDPKYITPKWTVLGAENGAVLTFDMKQAFIYSITIKERAEGTNYYGIKTSVTGTGTVTVSTANNASYEEENGDVTLNVTPDDGFELKEFSVKTSSGSDVNSVTQDETDKTQYTFKMPAEDVVVSATFEAAGVESAVTAGTCDNGTVTVTEGITKVEGEKVVIGDVATFEANEGYHFKAWKVTDASGKAVEVTKSTTAGDAYLGKYVFTMPGTAATISAEFEADSTKLREFWDFMDITDDTLFGVDNTKEYEYSSGEHTVAGLTINGVFKTKGRAVSSGGQWVQVAAGTTIKVPVAGPCKVTVVTYAANGCTVDGEAFSDTSSRTGIFICNGKIESTGEDTTRRIVTIAIPAGISQAYLGSIKVEPVDAYNITVPQTVDHATITHADYAIPNAGADTKVKISELVKEVTIDDTEAYGLIGWKAEYTDGDGTKTITAAKDGEDYTFTMPAANVTVTPIITEKGSAKQYSITILDGYHGTAVSLSGKDLSADENSTVTLNNITSHTPDDGYKFEGWYVTQTVGGKFEKIEVNKASGLYTFTMPSNDVHVMPIFSGAADGTYDFTKQDKSDRAKNVMCDDIGTITFTNFGSNNDKNGFYPSNNASMEMTLSGKATVTVVTCYYPSGDKTMKAYLDETEVDVASEDVAEGSQTGKKFTVLTETGGVLKLSGFTQNNYVHSVTVTYPPKVEGISEIPANTYDFQKAVAGNNAGLEKFKDYIIFSNIIDDNNSHGFFTAKDGSVPSMSVKLSGKAKVTVEACGFMAGKDGTMTATNGTVIKELPSDGENKGSAPRFTIINASAGDLTMTFGGNMYIHNMAIEYIENELYTVTVKSGENGTASASPVFAAEGDTVTLTAAPNGGCALTDWTVEAPDSGVTINKDEKDANKATFKMPAANVTVSAAFQMTGTPYNITVADGTNGTVTEKASDQTAISGATVIVGDVADFEANEGYHFKAWKVTDASNNAVEVTKNTKTGDNIGKYVFIMPESDVTISAEFEKDSTELRKYWNFMDVTDDTLFGVDNTKDYEYGSGSGEHIVAGLKINGFFRTKGRISSGYAQVDADTTIKVPVDGPCKVTVVTYEANGCTVDGQSFSDPSSRTGIFNCKGTDNIVTIAIPNTVSQKYITSIKVDLLKSYNIKVAESVEHATITPVEDGVISALEGETVKLSKVATVEIADADADTYELISWKVTYTDNNAEKTLNAVKGADGEYTFTMPAADVTVIPIISEGIEAIPAGTYDFQKPKEGSAADNKNADLEDFAKYIIFSNITDDNNIHGFYTNKDGSVPAISMKLSGKAQVTVEACGFMAGKDGTMTATNGTVIKELPSDGENGTAPRFTVLNASAGDLTMTFGGNMYIHNITIEYIENDRYAVIVKSDETGTASADPVFAEAGETVTLTALPRNVTYKLGEWKVVSPSTLTLSNDAEDPNTATFTMPASDVEIEAVFVASGEKPPAIADDFTLDFFAKASGHTAGEKVISDVDGLTINNFTWFDSSNNHGIRRGNDASMELNLKQKAYIIVTTCAFATSGDITSDSATVVPLEKVDINGDKDAPQYFIRADEGEVVLNFTVGYIHKMELVYIEDDHYTVTVDNDGHGTASTDKQIAPAGGTVTLTATPDDRYQFKEWQVISGDVEIGENNQFTMPAEDVKVKAIFESIIRNEWDFVNDKTLIGANGKKVEGKTESVEGLVIDATAAGSGWDSTITDKNGAVAKGGTKITVKVEGLCQVNVDAENNNYKVDGTAAKTANDTFECEGNKKDSSGNNIIVIETTADNHIKLIKVTPLYYAAEGLHDFTPASANLKIDGFSFNKFTDQDNSHGFAFSQGATMTLNLRKKANISVISCGFGSGTSATMESSTGTASEVEVSETGMTAKGMKFTVLNADPGELILTFGGSSWIHNVIVEYIDEIKPGSRNIDVWDFGAKSETDTADFSYNNNITADGLKGIVNTAATGTKGAFNAGYTAFGGLTMYHAANDRLYTNETALSDYNYGDYASAQKAYDDYTASGMWYVNATGSSTSGCVEIKMQAGDKLIAYMGSSGNGALEFIFEGQIGASGDTDSVTIASGEYQKCEFVAQKTGVYKIYAAGNGKPAYHRFVRIPGVGVSGTVNLGGNSISGYTVKFRNLDTGISTLATVNSDNSFDVILAPGYTYRAVLSGASGYGFTSASKNVAVTDKDYKNGKTGVELVVESKPTYVYSGKIEGFANGYDKISDLKVTMIADEESESEDVELEIAQSGVDITFSANLDPETEYTFKLEGVNDYEVTDPAYVCNDDESDYTNSTINVGLKPMYDVTGGFANLPVSATVKVSKLTFTNLDDNYVYEAGINDDGKGYSIKLRNGTYVAAAEVEGYSTSTHVAVNSGAVSRDLLFVSTGTKDKIKYVETIYVGYKDNRENNYKTVSEAVEACKLMDRSSGQRVTVNIAPGTYREQIVVDTPNVSFVNDSDGEVLLTWYYGIGYKYYSADESGYYNPANAYDKYDKHIANRWGVAVYVKSAATGFRAEGITFENSFNRYITDEELEDGVEVAGNESIDVVRKYSTDVTSRAATERAAAIAVEADQSEFKNCGFYSSQDTVYTQGSHIYFKNCVIEGQTDYIYGSGNCVFDACELSWKGYSGNSLGGYITANRPSSDKGYLFRNCTVTANHYNKLSVTSGYFGRPWGADAAVVFMNTKLQDAKMITAEGWTDMSGASAVKANFYEYKTTTTDGTAVDTSKRVRGVMTAEDAAKINVSDYFGTWKPYYYVEEAETLEFTKNPSVTDNGDINAPYPGHTLTVNYSLGEADNYDVSIIRWDIVDADGTETLAKSSIASVDKTYKIEKKATGKHIKVTVTPATVGGKVGSPESYTVEEAVRDGWDDPSGGGDIEIGDGINIFLAGDSTVKDYSANGMYNSGNALNEGSWGEFLQAFFDESQVKIQNYAQGGRSSRTFINEGKLDNIKLNMSEGDYLFIQFGHNDCSGPKGYPERYVPVGTPDSKGIYPSTPGTKDSSGNYPDGGEGTFKWFLKQYIDAAEEKGGIPVLVTPVARMYYTSDGTIRTHHDDETSSNDAYVTAMKQLAEEENVLLIDGFELTKALFEAAWKADDNNNDTYGKQIMSVTSEGKTDATHSNKLGGLIEAALIANAIKGMDLNISTVLKAPSRVLGEKPDGTEVFSIDANGKLTAYDIITGNSAKAAYWETIGQDLLDAIGGGSENPPVKPETVAAPTADKVGEVEKDTVIKLQTSTADASIYYTIGENPAEPTSDSELYDDIKGITITEATTIKAIAYKEGYNPSPVATFVYTIKTEATVEAPIFNPEPDNWTQDTPITLTAEGADEIRYTTDGTVPTAETGTKYTEAISIAATTTITAVAVKDGKCSEAVKRTYTVNNPDLEILAAPTAEPGTGEYDNAVTVTLTAEPSDATIYYTLDGSVPDRHSTPYTGAITISETTTLKAFAVKEGYNDSKPAEFVYTIKADGPSRETVEKPTAEPASGEVESGTIVKLYTATSGAEIRYTMGDNPADPTNVSTLYNAEQGIEILSSTTIKAIALKEGMDNSPVAEFNYTVSNKDEDGLIISFADAGNGYYEYTGSAIKPEIEVRNNGKLLIPGDDYTVKYSNNINVPATGATKKPTVTITGKGILTGKAVKEFSITPKSFEDVNADGENDVVAGRIVVAKNKKVPVPSVYYGSTKLKAGKDFTYTAPQPYTAETDDATITITGAGNFKDYLEVPVKVVADANAVKEAIKKFKVSIDKEKATAIIYNGADLETEIKAAIKVEPAKSGLTVTTNDYLIVLPKDITNAGTVIFTVVGIGDYSGCNITKSCKILPRTIAKENVVIDDGEAVAADGKVLVSGITDKATFASTGATFPDMNLTYGSGEIDMKLGVDYKVSYSSNKKVADGKAKYTITFMGNYKGKYTSVPFDIESAELDDSTAEVVIPDMVCNGKDGVYKSKPYVTINNVTLKASEYKVTYYLDDPDETETPKEMDKNNKLSFGEGEISKTVYVKIEPSTKSNYKNTDTTKTLAGSYTVWKKGSKDTDLSKAKVTFYEGSAKATKKLSYTGKEIELIKWDGTSSKTDGNCYIQVEINKNTVAPAAYDVEYVSNVNKGKATVVIKPAADSVQDDTTTAYTGGKVATFTIAARKLADNDWFTKAKQAWGF